MLGLLGGIIWGVGMVFNLVAANFTGVAISYALGNQHQWSPRYGEFLRGRNLRAVAAKPRCI